MIVVIGLLTIIICILVLIAYEIRIRKPDQVVLFEKGDKIQCSGSKFYFRHFNLPISKTAYSFLLISESSAKGNIDIKVKLSATVAPSIKNLQQLIKVGGWNKNASIKAAKDLEIMIHSLIKEYAEKFEIEELSSEKISLYINQQTDAIAEKFGLDIISLTVQSFEACDPQISEAMRQRESARILEQTEILNQKARISATRAKLIADEEIAMLEHDLEMKRFVLKDSETKQESLLAYTRIEEELKRKRMKLELEKEELEMIKNSPELLMLTPQAARLAEASQGFKNARTIVSLSPAELNQGADLLGFFQSMLKNAADDYNRKLNDVK